MSDPVQKKREACERLAAGLSGTEVLGATMAATDAVWNAGLDHAYAKVVRREGVTEANAERFHGQWLDALHKELCECVRRGLVAREAQRGRLGLRQKRPDRKDATREYVNATYSQAEQRRQEREFNGTPSGKRSSRKVSR